MIVTPKYGLLEYHVADDFWSLNTIRPTAVSLIEEHRRLTDKGCKLHMVFMEQVTAEEAIQQEQRLFTAEHVRSIMAAQRKEMIEALTKMFVKEPHGEWDAGHTSAVRECIQAIQKT